MGTKIKQLKNSTTYLRCPKDKKHHFTRVPANIVALGGYKEAIMTQIISNSDDFNIVKSEIFNRLDFPERKFLNAWKELETLGYIKIERKWGSYHYTINENPNYTTCTDADCIEHTTGKCTSCTAASLTTINNNYYNTGGSGQSENKSGKLATQDHKSPEFCEQFAELTRLYPKDVIRPDGFKHSLKTDIESCKKLYAEYLGEGRLSHTGVVKCLQAELKERTWNGKMMYIKKFAKWLETREFEAYKDKIDQPDLIPYGTELL